MWTILTKGRIGETYLIDADGERSNIEVLRAILAAFGREPDDFEWVRDRPGRQLLCHRCWALLFPQHYPRECGAIEAPTDCRDSTPQGL